MTYVGDDHDDKTIIISPYFLGTISYQWSTWVSVRCSGQKPTQNHRSLPPSTAPNKADSIVIIDDGGKEKVGKRQESNLTDGDVCESTAGAEDN